MLKNCLSRPDARIQIFSETILGEAKRLEIQCLSPKGEFWISVKRALELSKKCVEQRRATFSATY